MSSICTGIPGELIVFINIIRIFSPFSIMHASCSKHDLYLSLIALLVKWLIAFVFAEHFNHFNNPNFAFV